MQITMKSSHHGSRDGARTERFEAGITYDLSRTPRELELAAVFIREGWAVELKAAPPAVVPELEQPAAPAPQRQAGEGKRRGR